MLRQFEAELYLPDGARAPASMGSILHGALMERLPGDYAAYLHTENLRPYSQSIRWDRETGRVLWRIGTLDRTAGEIIGGVLHGIGSIHLRQKGYSIDVQNIQCIAQRSYQDIADEYFRAETAPRGAEIHFLTPTSFKQGGAYIILPESALILQSLLTRWNRFCPDIRIEEDDLVQTLAAHTRLTATPCALRRSPSRGIASAAFADRSPCSSRAATWCAASSVHSSPLPPTRESASKPHSAWVQQKQTFGKDERDETNFVLAHWNN